MFGELELRETVPIGHSLVILAHAQPWTAQSAARDVFYRSSVVSVEELDLISRRFLCNYGDDADTLGWSGVTQPIDLLISDVHANPCIPLRVGLRLDTRSSVNEVGQLPPARTRRRWLIPTARRSFPVATS